uniref:Uncharacterized protein n=1 Tax=Oryza sativa subsp. japonica TaxID=39947 RepID=Q60EN5_ORYSJ|nr:hypothetical protein [Oryza sativa Japonica Group]
MEGGGRQEWSWAAAAAGGRGRPPWPAAEVARHPRMKPSRGSSGWRRLALSRKVVFEFHEDKDKVFHVDVMEND